VHVPWSIQAERNDDLKYIPTMRTDITLSSEEETIIIDAKFYKTILQTYRGGSPKLRSEHLYQMQSYMRHGREQYGENVSGILLYAATGEGELHLRYKLEDMSLQVVTLDLDQPWTNIASNVLAMVGASGRYH